MSQSWNHTISALSDEDLGVYKRMGSRCSWPRCHESPTHEGMFDSVTGGAGRVNTRRKILCADHAEAFAARHDIPVAHSQS